MSNAGQRGGTTVSLAQARSLFAKWKKEEMGWLKARIIYLAEKNGEFHGDHLEGTELSERNIIGAVVNALTRGGLLVSTGEHRPSKSEASHGRRSYVYVLTDKGKALAATMHRVSPKSLPERPQNVAGLFDVTPDAAGRSSHVDVSAEEDLQVKEAPRPHVVDWGMVQAANEAHWARDRKERERHEAEKAGLRWDAS